MRRLRPSKLGTKRKIQNTSLGLLAGLVVVRTFLSWTLVLEIEGRWPWSPEIPTEHATRQENRAIP